MDPDLPLPSVAEKKVLAVFANASHGRTGQVQCGYQRLAARITEHLIMVGHWLFAVGLSTVRPIIMIFSVNRSKQYWLPIDVICPTYSVSYFSHSIFAGARYHAQMALRHTPWMEQYNRVEMMIHVSRARG